MLKGQILKRLSNAVEGFVEVNAGKAFIVDWLRQT